jgi:MFS family permease
MTGPDQFGARAMDGRILARGPTVWALAAGQTLLYACLYYVFAALILPWHEDLGWDKRWFALGPTLALLIAAVLAPWAGGLVDRGRAPEALGLAPIVGAAGLGVLALSDGYGGYLLGWGLVGLGCASGLYEVCFAFLIRQLGPDARPAIVRVTLVAGFASTLAFPAGAALSQAIGWRGALWVAVVVLVLLAAPLQWLSARRLQRAASGLAPPAPLKAGAARPHAGGAGAPGRRRAFWLLAALFALVGVNHWMMIAFLVPVFVELGAMQATAVLAASVVGPAQVAGRLVLMAGEARIGNVAASWATVAGFVGAVAVLALASGAPWLIFAYAAVQGSAIGVMTILKPMLIADVMGHEDYGAVAGAIQVPSLLAVALAPLIGAGVLDFAHVPGLLTLSAILSLAALAILGGLPGRAPR